MLINLKLFLAARSGQRFVLFHIDTWVLVCHRTGIRAVVCHLAYHRRSTSIRERKDAGDNFREGSLPVAENTLHLSTVEHLAMEMFISSPWEGFLHILAELYAEFCKFLEEQLRVIVVGNVAYPLVLVERFRVIELVVSLVCILVLLTRFLGVEGSHDTDTTDAVLRVHVVHLVAERCEVHTCRSTCAVDESDHLLTLLVGIVDSLLVIVLSPCRTTWSVDVENVPGTELVICSLNHPIAMFGRTIGASSTISGDGTIDIEYIDERFIHFVQIPTGMSLTFLSNLVLLDDRLCILAHYVARLILLRLKRSMCSEVRFQHYACVVSEVRANHPDASLENFEKSFVHC